MHLKFTFGVPPLFIASLVCAKALSPPPSSSHSFGFNVARNHETDGVRHFVHVSDFRGEALNQLRLTLTVAPNGTVTNAQADPKSELLKYWPTIKPKVLSWKFQPFMLDDNAVTAQIEEYVEVVPSERDTTYHVAPPTLRPNSEVVITLERTLCYGSCPAYKVVVSTLHGIVFDGFNFVQSKGTTRDQIDPNKVRELARKFIAADFYSMDNSYVQAVTDSPTYRLSIAIDGHSKEVIDYVGYQVGMPDAITDLEMAVDRLAQTQRWVKAVQ